MPPVTVTGAALLSRLPTGRGCSIVRDNDTTIVAIEPAEVRSASGDAAFVLLDDAARGGFWIGYLAYDLGRSIEDVRSRSVDDLRLPDVVLARYDARLVLRPGREPEVVGDGAAARMLAQAAWRAQRTELLPLRGVTSAWRSSLDREAHRRAVAAVSELLVAGECYQVNLTRRLQADSTVDPAQLFTALSRSNPAPHAALCTFGSQLPPLAIVSASPELFLRVDGRTVVTRPIKGTAVDASTLEQSAKDHAENVMIVDLSRNDLGRVCEYGSIEVPELCAVEAHPGLHHLVSTVRGRLRADIGLAELVRATFPPASVTGAPKPRVLQAIEDLEPVRRGVYCGAVGWIDGDVGRAELAVAIRTFTIVPGATSLGVGGGIVADSRADAEWEETELKAARLLAAAAGGAVGVSIR
jgi:para-aminobenzoate synthetase component I